MMQIEPVWVESERILGLVECFSNNYSVKSIASCCKFPVKSIVANRYKKQG